ncbi:MAG: Glyoxalase family protein, partial [uncultured Thermomicrobiales bacterium]
DRPPRPNRRRRPHRPRPPQGGRPRPGDRLLPRRPRLRPGDPDGGAGGLPLGGRLPPPHRAEYLGERRRLAAAGRDDGALPRRHQLPGAARPGRRPAAAAGAGLADRRRLRPRHPRGDLPRRPGRQRDRAGLGPGRGRMAAPGRPARLRQPAARLRRTAGRGRCDRSWGRGGRRGRGRGGVHAGRV